MALQDLCLILLALTLVVCVDCRPWRRDPDRLDEHELVVFPTATTTTTTTAEPSTTTSDTSNAKLVVQKVDHVADIFEIIGGVIAVLCFIAATTAAVLKFRKRLQGNPEDAGPALRDLFTVILALLQRLHRRR